mmetsp:Transcript_8198/g.12409  ORF Transcript_8198/g.12409 Transcript_8198/m.12409 type:complete len:219 (+) Transcript_8198:82-738(+)
MNQTQTVHLTECLDLFSESNSFDSEVRDCLSTFFLKTTTNFHNADMQFNPLFGALCWSFSLGGFVMVTVKPKWLQRSSFPYRLYAYVLMFVQGPLSFSADYINMANDSFVHVIDKLLATFMFVMYLWRLASLFHNARPSNFILQLAAFCLALFSFMNSQDAQEAHDIEGFKFWHNMWHCFPLNLIVIELHDRFVLGEYDALSNSSIDSDLLASKKKRV